MKDREKLKEEVDEKIITNCINTIGWHPLLETLHRPHSTLYEHCTGIASFLFRFLIPEDGTDRLSRNVGKELPPLTAK
jgi:hypothetical protein